jgi:hypothetical protein
MRAERIDANSYPARKAARPDTRRHAMKPVDMDTKADVRPAAGADMDASMDVVGIGERRRRKRRCKQKSADKVTRNVHGAAS